MSATFFAQVFTATGGYRLVSGIITGLPFGPYGIIAIMMWVLIVLGMFMDSFGHYCDLCAAFYADNKGFEF